LTAGRQPVNLRGNRGCARREDPMRFLVDLDVYRGPLDLLLYLVRRHEVEIADLPLAPITQQFLEYVQLLQELDYAHVGEFLDVASTLVEMKSREVLPRIDEPAGDEQVLDDPRHDLVRRLLEYKKYREAAMLLDERSRAWQERFARIARDRPDEHRDLEHQPIRELEVWDLLNAFSRVMRDNDALQPTSIVYDETPIHVYMARIRDDVCRQGRVAFSHMFHPGMHKSALIGVFLAMMELVRHHGIRAEQESLFGEIWLYPGQRAHEPLDLAAVASYEHPSPAGRPQRQPTDPR
jgi:segregation and condensation protein A